VVRALRDGNPFKARSGNGNQVLTDQRLSLYAAWFENQFRQNPNVKSCRFFQEGLDIAGLHGADIDKFLALPVRREEIDSRKSLIFNQVETEFNAPEEKQKRTQKFDNAVSVLERGLKSIKTAAEEGAEIARKALKYPLPARNDVSTQQNRILKQLDKIMRSITESEVKEIAGFLFPPMQEPGSAELGSTEETDSLDPFRAYLKSSHGFFSGIVDAIKLY